MSMKLDKSKTKIVIIFKTTFDKYGLNIISRIRLTTYYCILFVKEFLFEIILYVAYK